MADCVENQFEYEGEGLISKHLKCLLCSKPFINPVSIQCSNEQNTYCRRCIEKWIDENHACPTCGRRLNRRSLNPIEKSIVTNIPDDFPMKCSKCNQTYLRSSFLSDHQDNMYESNDAVTTCHSNDNHQSSKDRNNQEESIVQILRRENHELKNHLKRTEEIMQRFQNRLDEQENENNQIKHELAQIKEERRLEEQRKQSLMNIRENWNASHAEKSSPEELDKYLEAMRHTLNSIKSPGLRSRVIQFVATLIGFVFKFVGSLNNGDNSDQVENQQPIAFAELAVETLEHIRITNALSSRNDRIFDANENRRVTSMGSPLNTAAPAANYIALINTANLPASAQTRMYKTTEY